MGLPLMTVRFDALFSRFLGATAIQLRAIFAEMPRRPGVYLFDEFDSVALYADLGSAVEHGAHVARHWIQGSRLLARPHGGTAADASHEKWPVLTHGAVRAAEDADSQPRNRVFTMAVTRTMQDPPFTEPVPTLWSHAVDRTITRPPSRCAPQPKN